MPSFRHALVIANPTAGRGRARDEGEALRAGLEACGVRATLRFTAGRGDAPRFVEERDPATDLVLAVGGDGSLREVLARAPTELCVGQLPRGTANVLALDLGLPRDVAGLLEAVRAGRTTRLDVAHVGDQLSFLVVGVGFDGETVRDVERRRRGPISRWTYVRAVLRVLARQRPPRLSVEVDGEALEEEFGWVLVSNIEGYGGIVQLGVERVLDDGEWEVLAFPRAGRLALLGLGVRGLLRRLPGPRCTVLRARHVRITAPTPVPYEIDGDFGAETPVEVSVSPVQRTILLAP